MEAWSKQRKRDDMSKEGERERRKSEKKVEGMAEAQASATVTELVSSLVILVCVQLQRMSPQLLQAPCRKVSA